MMSYCMTESLCSIWDASPVVVGGALGTLLFVVENLHQRPQPMIWQLHYAWYIYSGLWTVEYKL